MKSIKVAGLCLVAAFALSAVSVASASAENAPKFIKCIKAKKVGGKYTGHYTEKTCNKEASAKVISEGKKNKYELEDLKEQGHGVHFSAKSGATTITAKGENGNSQVVVCAKDKYVGEIFNSYAAGKIEGTFTFEDCKGNGSEACGNVGAETIRYKPNYTETLWSAIGETKPVLALVYGPAFKCGSEEVELAGVLLGTIENNSKGLNIAFKLVGGKQEDQTFWAEEEEYTSEHWYSEPSEEEATLKGSEALKVKGVSVHKV